MWFNFLDQTLNVLGYSRKKTEGGVEDILFGKAPVEYFIFLPLEIPGKTKLHSWKFYKIVLNPLKIPRSKTKCPGISTLFFLGHPWKLQLTPGNFTCSFFDTPGNSISPLPLFFFFFLELPIEHPSHMHQMIKVRMTYRGIILLSMAWFSSSHLRRINFFLINFSGLQQKVFPIFKLPNSTEAAYDN